MGGMATISTAIELEDKLSGVLNNVLNTVSMTVSAIEKMNGNLDKPIEAAYFDGIRDNIASAAVDLQHLSEGIERAREEAEKPIDMPAAQPVTIPVQWQSDTMDIFTNSGIERFEQEAQSANDLLQKLGDTQNTIAANSQQTSLFPPQMTADLTNMHGRIMAISQQIRLIESNPLNMGTDIANNGLEQLRGQLNQAIQEQEILNAAVDSMDIEAANQAYLRLSQTVGNTERYIRDNVDEQGRFNREIQEGVNGAENLAGMIKKAIGAYVGIGGIKKAFSFIQDCTASFDTQLNSEIQLISVLSNTIGDRFAAGVELETTADTTAMTEQINAAANASEAVVSVTAETNAVTAAFNDIKDKAAEIQSQGIYGDEAMIAAGAEFSTYFTDTGAIEMMMDTLADYAMGMSGGGAIDKAGMVDYATGLGKIMTGSYDAMTKKGFEFTDVQKAIIEGTATQEQIAATIGEEYIGMSQDMQAAAAISAVIGESWDGLYEKMSNTPEGKIVQMSNAWGDMKEVIGGQLYPYVLLFVNAVTNNWSTIEGVVQGITTGLQFMLGVLSWLVEGAFAVADAIIENWSWISPIIYGVAGALAIYYGWQFAVNMINLVSKGIHMLMAAAQMMHAAATGSLTAATVAEIAAQNGLNAAMYACPIVWIIVLIIALIAIFYAAVAAVNHFAGTSISATGIIAGIFTTLGAHLINMFIVPIWNKFAAIANFFGNVFNDPVAAVKVLFYDMCLTVIGFVQNLAQGIEDLINKIPGVSIDITSGLDGFYSSLEEAQQKVKDESEWVEYVGKMDYINYEDAWNAGYSFGEGIDESVSNFDPSSLFNSDGIPGADDFTDLYNGVYNIDDNTSNIADSLSVTDEELKYLRDIAERETVNRFTTAEITVEQTNNNNISSDTDLDGIVNGITDAVTEAVFVVTEGVHV